MTIVLFLLLLLLTNAFYCMHYYNPDLQFYEHSVNKIPIHDLSFIYNGINLVNIYNYSCYNCYNL